MLKLIDSPPMSLGSISMNGQPGFSLKIPDCFASLEEAQNSLSFHRNHCLQAAFTRVKASRNENLIDNWAKVVTDDDFNLFQSTFIKWASAFQGFLDRYSATLGPAALQGAAVLKISRYVTELNLECLKMRLRGCQTSWDQHRSICEDIVDLATTIVRMQSFTNSSTQPSTRAPVFSLDVGIVCPLYMVVFQCRDPIIRRRSIALLYSAPRQEGFWNSINTARVCEKIMLVEEAGLGEVKCAEDIPNSNRINEVDVRFDMQGRKAYLTLNRRLENAPSYEPPLCVFQEVLEW